MTPDPCQGSGLFGLRGGRGVAGVGPGGCRGLVVKLGLDLLRHEPRQAGRPAQPVVDEQVTGLLSNRTANSRIRLLAILLDRGPA
jgi:hypothetical protein